MGRRSRPKSKASKEYYKQIIQASQEDSDSNKTVVVDFNTSISALHKSISQRLNGKTLGLKEEIEKKCGTELKVDSQTNETKLRMQRQTLKDPVS